jgi:hypothetical protein
MDFQRQLGSQVFVGEHVVDLDGKVQHVHCRICLLVEGKEAFKP